MAIDSYPDLTQVTPGTKFQGLRTDRNGNQTEWAPIFSRYFKTTAAVDVNNTTTETSLASFTVTANDMSAVGSVLRLRLYGAYSNANSSQTITFRIKFGGSTIVTISFTTNNHSGTHGWEFRAELAVSGTNSEKINGEAYVMSAVGQSITCERGTASATLSSNQTFEITVQHGSTTPTLTMDEAFAELMPA